MQTSPVPVFATPRGPDYDYELGRDLGRDLGGLLRGIDSPLPRPFVWGKVLRVHVIGEDYALVEHVPNRPYNVPLDEHDQSPAFHVFVRGATRSGWDTSRSCGSLDSALLTAIAWKAEMRRGGFSAAANSQAVSYVTRMLGLSEI